jgi:uncharacterized membrane protein YhhN
MYVAAFAQISPLRLWMSTYAVCAAAVSAGVFMWLKPHLGKMAAPVIAYVVVITVMLMGAMGVLRSGGLQPFGQWLVFWGALLFYISDLFVARQRFVAPSYLNRAVGLPLYYIGQYMLAYSVGTVMA